ncbi:hypothetical protein ACP4OV_019405 [Aristida adscensionis]
MDRDPENPPASQAAGGIIAAAAPEPGGEAGGCKDQSWIVWLGVAAFGVVMVVTMVIDGMKHTPRSPHGELRDHPGGGPLFLLGWGLGVAVVGLAGLAVAAWKSYCAG